MDDAVKRCASDFNYSDDSRLNLMQAQLHEITRAMGKMPDRESKTGLERHAQTVLAAVAIGLIAWVGLSVTEGSKALAKMEVVTQQLQESVKEMKDEVRRATSTHVTKEEMIEARTECMGKITQIDDRLRKLESGRPDT